jgi:membrane-bound lytic murein transglycosylase A
MQERENRHRSFWIRLICLLCLPVLLIFQGDQGVCGPSLQVIDPSGGHVFDDDFDRRSLLQAGHRQAASLRRIPAATQYKLADRTVTAARLLASLESFIEILERESDPRNIARILQETFVIYQAAGRENAYTFGEMQVTGYFAPLLEGSLLPASPFLYPIYRPPPDLIGRKAGSRTVFGRLQGDTFLPYWSRAEIETRKLLAGNELVYLRDPFEAFLLHIQGSGKIRLRDGSCKAVRYAASNGQPYRSIGKLLVDEGKLTREQATLPGIEAYLQEHPGEMVRILHSNPRYIFFAWENEPGTQGSNNITLTAGRSVAVDQEIIPPGTIAFLSSRRPVFDDQGRLKDWLPLERFVFPQDSGAAIKGPGRVDLFLGDSHEARLAAGLMREKGSLYVLLKK